MPATFTRAAFTSIASELRAALDWVALFSAGLPSSRVDKYRHTFDELLQVCEQRDLETANRRFGEFINTLFEVHELVYMHQWLGDLDACPYLRARVPEIIKGPVQYSLESSSSSNRARNIAFELLLAARIRQAKLDLELELGADTACLCNNRRLLFECKRPRSRAGLERNVTRAAHQLKTHYARAARSRYRGVVALDLTPSINPQFRMLVVNSSTALNQALNHELEQCIDSHLHLWKKIQSRKTIGVLLRLALMAEVRTEGGSEIVYCQQYCVTPLTNTGDAYATMVHLGAALADPATSAHP